MTREIMERKQNRLETLKYSVQQTQEYADKTLSHLINFGFEEKILEIVRQAFGKKEHSITSEIGAIKKQLGLPTQSEIKKAKKEASKTLSDEAKSAIWGTYGPDGKQLLSWVYLVDCSTEHLNNIMAQIARYPTHGHIPLIMEILAARK